MDNEIEKLKQERDEILAKALRLIELDAMAWEGTAISRKDWDAAVAELQALRPKPKPLELWVNVYPDQYGDCIYKSEVEARLATSDTRLESRIAVHMREVLPAPKWERWDRDEVRGRFHYVRDTVGEAESFARIADRHNAEMERLAALWEGGAE